MILLLRRARVRAGIIYAAAETAAWVAALKSGVDPVVVGLAMGLMTYAHPAARTDLERLFALANAGIPLSGAFLARAYTSPLTLGILIGYVAGKPLGITGSSWLLTRLSRGRLRPPVGWATVAGVGTIAGIGFAVSILIATLAFTGTQLQQAKLQALPGGSTVISEFQHGA